MSHSAHSALQLYCFLKLLPSLLNLEVDLLAKRLLCGHSWFSSDLLSMDEKGSRKMLSGENSVWNASGEPRGQPARSSMHERGGNSCANLTSYLEDLEKWQLPLFGDYPSKSQWCSTEGQSCSLSPWKIVRGWEAISLVLIFGHRRLCDHRDFLDNTTKL